MASSLDNDWIPPNVVRWRGAPGEQQSRGTSKTNSTATNVSINVSSVDSLDELLFCKEQEWKALKLAKELLQNVTGEYPSSASNQSNIPAHVQRAVRQSDPMYDSAELTTKTNTSNRIIIFEVFLRAGSDRKHQKISCEVKVDVELRMVHIFEWASHHYRDTFHIPSTQVGFERASKRFYLSKKVPHGDQLDLMIDLNSDADYEELEVLLKQMQDKYQPHFLSLTGPMEAGRTEEQTYY